MRLDGWMDELMQAAVSNGLKGSELDVYQRENWFQWRHFFREQVKPEIAFREDLELARLIGGSEKDGTLEKNGKSA